jgi:hypothetical protein
MNVRSLEPDSELVREFFVEFARFEYALKRAGFHCGEGKARADWTKFAETVAEVLEKPASEALRAAVEYYLEEPPKRQVVRGGQLAWEESEPCTKLKADKILIYVRRVRNNLFHGGKFRGEWFENPPRSETLIKHGLEILRVCRSASRDVDEAFRN